MMYIWNMEKTNRPDHNRPNLEGRSTMTTTDKIYNDFLDTLTGDDRLDVEEFVRIARKAQMIADEKRAETADPFAELLSE